MKRIVRFGVSIPQDLLLKFDYIIKKKGYPTRSKAIADLITEEIVKTHWQKQGDIAGAITLIYNHNKRELLDKLVDIQHDFQKIIISTQHIHLDEDNCLEIIAIKGSFEEAQKLADVLKAVKGVSHGVLSISYYNS